MIYFPKKQISNGKYFGKDENLLSAATKKARPVAVGRTFCLCVFCRGSRPCLLHHGFRDLFAGLAIVAWADFLLGLGRFPPIRSWKQTVPLLLACGLVWEVLAPLWKPGAILDPWDFLAYQIGGGLWLLLSRPFPRWQ